MDRDVSARKAMIIDVLSEKEMKRYIFKQEEGRGGEGRYIWD
jgi:hypothetical protein